mmetsp:Transcript_46063/g.131481  ORF Transcript_46063/g.131481 Transcript_46063/m.131481 type:complete len:99 (+) Transcript_46063:3-299(+)
MMFCFRHDNCRQSTPEAQPHVEQPTHAAHDGPGPGESAEQPAAAPHCYMGRATAHDPAHGWLEVELTVENAAALFEQMRGAVPAQRCDLGGIFELTAV